MTAPRRPCSAAAALSLIGEKYSLLALREVLFGVRRFDAIARNTGAPRDVLAARLRRLVATGILERAPYSTHPPRSEYRLTQAGRELQPVLLALMRWGDRWALDEPVMRFEHRCGAALDPLVVCAACGDAVAGRDLTPRYLVPGWAVGGPVPLRAMTPAPKNHPNGG